MRKSALLFAAAVLALGLPTAASAAPKKEPPKDPNANSKKFVGDWVGQIFVPGQSLAKGAAAAPAKAAKPAKKAKKKAAKAKPAAAKPATPKADEKKKS